VNEEPLQLFLERAPAAAAVFDGERRLAASRIESSMTRSDDDASVCARDHTAGVLPETPCEKSEGETATSAASASYRVLVVDDVRDVADSLVMLLQTLGADVRAVYDGEAALAAVVEFRPQLALVDISMPKMDGYETARRIRLLPEGRDIVLAALSGWGQEDDRRRAFAAGFDHHFLKPVDIDALEKLLNSDAIGG
jgi:CheY-like chemotaxis protein